MKPIEAKYIYRLLPHKYPFLPAIFRASRSFRAF